MNATLITMNKAPIRDNIGRLRLRQCFPKLRIINTPHPYVVTPHDVESKIIHILNLIRITRGG
jgi:hypothetical protein